jgi:tRNA pseudouridine13 synthase
MPVWAGAIDRRMKLKQQPEDFQVEELTDRVGADGGPFAFYRLEKTGWNTLDALQVIRRRWQLDFCRVSYGGLKDRHAQTTQYLTIYRGPMRGLTHPGFQLHYLGRLGRAYTSQDIRANRFRVTLRALAAKEAATAAQALEEVQIEGVPNYFDDQRFGSVGAEGDFVARHLALGQYEQALRVALAGPYEFDRAAQKQEKAILQAHWGDWAACKARLGRGHARSLVDYLVSHPSDFRGALERLRPELRSLYLSVYQSHLWNRMLARWLEQHLGPERLVAVPFRRGTLPMHRGLEPGPLAELAHLRLPLPSARGSVDPADARNRLMAAVLQEEEITREQLKLKGFRQLFFSRGERAALCVPAELSWQSDEDERHPNRQRLTLAFELARGCYATLIVKRITAIRVNKSV